MTSFKIFLILADTKKAELRSFYNARIPAAIPKRARKEPPTLTDPAPLLPVEEALAPEEVWLAPEEVWLAPEPEPLVAEGLDPELEESAPFVAVATPEGPDPDPVPVGPAVAEYR